MTIQKYYKAKYTKMQLMEGNPKSLGVYVELRQTTGDGESVVLSSEPLAGMEQFRMGFGSYLGKTNLARLILSDHLIMGYDEIPDYIVKSFAEEVLGKVTEDEFLISEESIDVHLSAFLGVVESTL